MLGSTSSTASALLIRRRTSCLACKRSRRQLGSSPPPAAGPVRTFNREDVAFPFCAPVPGRSVLRITGRDASRFLNGLAAVRIPETLETGLSPLYAAFLHAQGRILHDTFIYSDPSTRSFLIDHPASATSPSPSSSTPLAPGGNGDGPPTLEAHLKRFVLRSKVGVKDVSSQWAVWAAWGHDEVDERTWGGVRRCRWGNGESAELGWKEEPARWVPRRASEGENPSDEVMGGWDARAPGMGWRGLIRRAEMATTTAPSLLSPSTSDPVPSAAYTAHRLSLGVPEGPKELVPLSALPSESNLDFMGGVDFRKGCYVGQELTVRTYHTGQTRKRIIPIELLGIGEEEKEQPEEALEGASVQLVFKPQTVSPNSADESASPSNPALNTLVAPTAAASRRPTRPKSTGRLLSYDRSTNQGLALLRLDQVNLCLSGEATLRVILPSAAAGEGQSGATGNPGHGQTQKGTERTVGLRPRLDKVDWWPVRPPPSPTVATGAATTSAASTPMPTD